MKKQTLVIIAMIIVICQFNLGTSFAQQVKEIPFKIDERSLKLKDREIMATSPLSLKIKIATQQPISDNGLQFAFVITNNSSTEISLGNPLINLTPKLIDEKGRFISVINEYSMMLINYRKFYVPKFEAFEIGDTFINGKKQEIDYHTSENISIPGNGTYQINLGVLNIRTNPSAATPKERTAAAIKIKKGKYKLSFGAVVATARTVKPFFSNILDTPEIEVDYGQ